MLLWLFGDCNTVLIVTVCLNYFQLEILKGVLVWKQSWKKFLNDKNHKNILILKDICPEYMTSGHHANGLKIAMTVNAQLSQD
jgi:hypothetical protein